MIRQVRLCLIFHLRVYVNAKSLHGGLRPEFLRLWNVSTAVAALSFITGTVRYTAE